LIARLLLIVLLVPAAYFGWQWLFPSDEAQIRALLTRVAEGLEGSGAPEGERTAGGLGAVARVARLQEEFAPDAVVEAGPPFQTLHGWPAIMSAAARVTVAVPTLDVRFTDVAVAVADDRQSAAATLVAEAHFREDGRLSMDARELEVTFARLDGRWVIERVTLLRPLERLDR
jgi:hypothetical protein